MANLNISFNGTLTFTSGTWQDFAAAITASLNATIDSAYILQGQIGGTQPVTNIGVWLNGNTWYYWNGSTYVPMGIVIGDGAGNFIRMVSNPTVDRVITVPDRNGTLALTIDIYTPRTTIVLSGTVIDWSTSFSFYKSISANTTFSNINTLPGQKITLVVESTGSYTVTHPAYILWEGGTPPVQTVSGTDKYTLENVSGAIYGKVEQDFS